jgi:hypothetical protein
MKRFLIYALLSGVVLITLPGCSKDSITGGDSTPLPHLIPLAIGNYWNYSVSIYDTAGAQPVSYVDSSQWRVLSDTAIGGYRWYRFAGSYACNKSDGFWMYLSATPSLYFRYPVIEGDTVATGGSLTVVVMAVAERDTIAGGMRFCHRYRVHIASALTTEYFIQPGLGIVRYDQYSQTQSGRTYRRTRNEIERYRLN